jgi:hypothetical protein
MKAERILEFDKLSSLVFAVVLVAKDLREILAWRGLMV